MMTQKMLVLIGIVLLIAGILLPLEGAPGDEYSTRLWDIDSENDIWIDGPGAYLLIILAVTVLMVLMARVEYVKLTGLLVFWIIFNMFAGSWQYLYNIKFDGVGIGWIALWVGCVLVCTPLWTGYLKRSDKGNLDEAETDEFDEDYELSDNELEEIKPASRIDFRRKLHLIGLAVLLIGFFMPIYKENSFTHFYSEVRLYGSIGYVMYALIIVTVALVFNQDEHVWFLGLMILGMIINDWRTLYQQVQNMEQTHLMWGWLVPINGAVILAMSVLADVDESERLFSVFGAVKKWWKSLDPMAPFEDDEYDDDNDNVELDNESDQPPELGDNTEATSPDESADTQDDA